MTKSITNVNHGSHPTSAMIYGQEIFKRFASPEYETKSCLYRISALSQHLTVNKKQNNNIRYTIVSCNIPLCGNQPIISQTHV